MKKLIFILASLILVSFSMAQEEHEFLKTEIKAKSKLNKSSKANGFDLVGISARFGKDMENHTKVNEELTKVARSGDTLIVEASIVANCCASFVTEIEAKDNIINLLFEKNDIDCMCLKGIYLTYKILAPNRDYNFQINGNAAEIRKIDPNAEREEMEFWDNGNMKAIKLYKGELLHTEHRFDETGKRVKTLFYKDGQVIEKTY